MYSNNDSQFAASALLLPTDLNRPDSELMSVGQEQPFLVSVNQKKFLQHWRPSFYQLPSSPGCVGRRHGEGQDQHQVDPLPDISAADHQSCETKTNSSSERPDNWLSSTPIQSKSPTGNLKIHSNPFSESTLRCSFFLSCLKNLKGFNQKLVAKLFGLAFGKSHWVLSSI